LASPTAGLDSPGMMSLMQQLMGNNELMQNMSSSPFFHSMMNYITRNPEMLQQALSLNPLFANNPQMMERVRNSSQFLQGLNNSDIQALWTNPQALEGLLQIQSGLEQLQRVAPGALAGM
jgi:PREDICTED: hypothetical protein, partial